MNSRTQAMVWILGLIALLWFTPAHAQDCAPNPNASGPPFTANCPMSAQGLNTAMTKAVAHATNNAALLAMSRVNLPLTIVHRDGFATGGDGGGADYIYSSSPCANSGNGDNGAQVKASDGGCWNADFSKTQPIPEIWGGALAGGTTDALAAINAGLASQAVLYTQTAPTGFPGRSQSRMGSRSSG